MKDNIIFIGMPAVGKSTVGVITAKRLGYRFIDTDILIQEEEGKLLKDIIRLSGGRRPCERKGIYKEDCDLTRRKRYILRECDETL